MSKYAREEIRALHNAVSDHLNENDPVADPHENDADGIKVAIYSAIRCLPDRMSDADIISALAMITAAYGVEGKLPVILKATVEALKATTDDIEETGTIPEFALIYNDGEVKLARQFAVHTHEADSKEEAEEIMRGMAERHGKTRH